MATTTATQDRTRWTLAWRNPRASSFHRAKNWEGTWAQAFELSSVFAKENPGLEVWYVTTAAYEREEAFELPQRVARGEISRELMDMYLEDHGNVLVDSGRRVRIYDNGRLSATVLAQVPDAAEAQARFDAGAE